VVRQLSPSLVGLRLGDEPAAWERAGYAVEAGRVQVGTISLHLAHDPGGAGGDVAWAFDPPSAGSIDGIATYAATAAAPGETHHPNGVDGLDHVVVATPAMDRTIDAFTQVGLELRRTRPTTLGRTPAVQAFFWAGDVIVEVVGPVEAMGDGPASIWGLAFWCSDLDGSIGWLGPERCGPASDAVQEGRRIATMRTREMGISTRIVLMSPHVATGHLEA
jgi:hypothetical protein